MVNLHLFTESNTFDIKNSKHVKCWKKSRLSRTKARHQQQQQTLSNFFGKVTNEKSILLYLGCPPHLRYLFRDKLFLHSVLYLFMWKVKKLKIQLYSKKKGWGGRFKMFLLFIALHGEFKLENCFSYLTPSSQDLLLLNVTAFAFKFFSFFFFFQQMNFLRLFLFIFLSLLIYLPLNELLFV